MAELILATPGAGTWTVPAGVTSIQVECWGGGGSGGYRFTNGAASGGGSAGWAKTNAIAVTPGQTVYFHVGAGGAARSGANLAGLDGEDTWLNVSANAAPASVDIGCLAQNGRNGNQGATVAGGASFVNGGAIGDTSRNGRNNNGVNAAGSANGGSGASTPLSLGDVAAFIGTAGVEGAGGNAGTGGGSGGAARTPGDDDADGGGGGGGSITASTMGGRGGQPGGGGGGAVTPATASGSGGDGRIRITYTAAPTAAARRVAAVMM
jgi:hypothetical protein